LYFALLAAALAHAQLPHFQHIIIVIQENRTPDNLFGGTPGNPVFEPGVDIQQANGAVPWCLGACFTAKHSHDAWKTMWNNGNWNNGQGACSILVTDYCTQNGVRTTCNGQPAPPLPSCAPQSYVSTSYDNSVVAPYFDIARKYGFANYFFQTNQGPSFPAHQFLFSGTSAPNGVAGQTDYQYFASSNGTDGIGKVGCNGPNNSKVKVVNEQSNEDVLARVRPCFNHFSLPTLLDNSLTSWKYYASSENSWATSIWTAPNSLVPICLPRTYDNQCSGYDWVNYVVHGPSDILTDLAQPTCGLKNVSWVIPNEPWADHPGFQHGETDSGDIEGGPVWVANIINTLGFSGCTDRINNQDVPYWQDTAVFITWDDWGGWWDHVPPYVVRFEDHNTNHCNPAQQFGCGFTSGFRVPLLVVSAYTTPGYVSGNTQTQGGEVFPYVHDFGSILAFIENNFTLGIGSINPAYPFADAFAPDYLQGVNVPLSDFFPLSTAYPRPFQAITLPQGAHDASYYGAYTGTGDPDNDVVDND
jgi:phospholipase C